MTDVYSRTVARGRPTDADRSLVAYAAEQGYEVTPRQIEDWRIAGALPPRMVESRGRGGRSSQDPPEANERLIAMCDYMFKRHRLGAREDVPRRRKVADAVLWMWYAGHPIPLEEIGAAVRTRWTVAFRELAAMRGDLDRANPDLPGYEIDHFVAERVAQSQVKTVEFRRLRTSFNRRPNRPIDPDPEAAIFGGYSQVVQMVFSSVEFESETLAHLFDLGAYVGNPSPGDPDPEWMDLLHDRLNLDVVLKAIRDLSDSDWQHVRLLLEAWNSMVLTGRRQSEDREFSRACTRLPTIATTPRLVTAIGALAALLPEIRAGLAERFDLELVP